MEEGPSITGETKLAAASAIDSKRINQSVVSMAESDVTHTRAFAASIIVRSCNVAGFRRGPGEHLAAVSCIIAPRDVTLPVRKMHMGNYNYIMVTRHNIVTEYTVMSTAFYDVARIRCCCCCCCCCWCCWCYCSTSAHVTLFGTELSVWVLPRSDAFYLI
jgi:hypothetical protein